MQVVDDTLIGELRKRLLALPSVGSGRERHESWMTAQQISHWWVEQRAEHVSPERIDAMLRSWWLQEPQSRDIRPAKYPDRNTRCRLWGHVQRVGRLSEAEIRLFRTDEPMELEKILLEPSLPQYFLSYAAPDLHYAARVRLFLAAYRVRSWMYAGEIKKGHLVFEGVQAALSASQHLLALATPLSLASAWVDTEMHSVDQNVKPVTIAFDGSNPALMRLLATWHPPRALGQPCFDLRLLPELRKEYARYYSKRRVAKYRRSASDFLWGATNFKLCIYPRRPVDWRGHERFVDFDKAIRGYLTIEGAS